MDINYNDILNRNDIYENIKKEINYYEINKNTKKIIKNGIYIYGNHGIGKSMFIDGLLNELDYNVIKLCYDDLSSKNKIINLKTKYLSNNIISIFKKEYKKKIILIDNLDIIKTINKGLIGELIKLVKPKKKLINVIIIFICNLSNDKKIKELKKNCICFKLNTPTNDEIKILLNNTLDIEYLNSSLSYIKGDLRKIILLKKLYEKNEHNINDYLFKEILNENSFNMDVKDKTNQLLNNKINLNNDFNFINETERTIVSLIFHENVVDILNKKSNSISLPLYQKILDNICYGDYIDRITFQKQIWQFNDITYLIKTYYTNYLLHNNIQNIKHINEIRFTKILTKYSTEYNNYIFIINLLIKLNIDKNDLFSYFIYLRNHHSLKSIENIIRQYDITLLEINRIYRYIDYLLI
jgi:hypothetical protein